MHSCSDYTEAGVAGCSGLRKQTIAKTAFAHSAVVYYSGAP
ncbi:hypothetical protein CPter291_4339 [Collimonas pratensis]|uniref:Lipoprotein n=1 Tax=Collimonas pratensis TaxID=279113 RepID=A0A127QAR0_9BURK|nr:hypothetical protein CPter91_4402 [Collimonas pratensis]AMP16566.1 hypothetical protein CPter291_4339 [Collimonas pratensis]